MRSFKIASHLITQSLIFGKNSTFFLSFADRQAQENQEQAIQLRPGQAQPVDPGPHPELKERLRQGEAPTKAGSQQEVFRKPRRHPINQPPGQFFHSERRRAHNVQPNVR